MDYILFERELITHTLTVQGNAQSRPLIVVYVYTSVQNIVKYLKKWMTNLLFCGLDWKFWKVKKYAIILKIKSLK